MYHEILPSCLQGPGLGSDEPEADGGYERVHGDGVGLLSRVIQCCPGCDVTRREKKLQLNRNLWRKSTMRNK